MSERAASVAAGRRLVGRTREIGELRAGLDAAVGGHGRSFLISGAAGIGKTRLATEVADDAERRGIAAFWGRCWEGGGAPPFWPWPRLLQDCLRRLGKTAPEMALSS